MRMMMPVIKNLKTKHHFLCSKCQTKRHWKNKKKSFRVYKIEQAITSMSDREKFHILKNHGEPTKNHLVPTSYDGGYYGSIGRE